MNFVLFLFISEPASTCFVLKAPEPHFAHQSRALTQARFRRCRGAAVLGRRFILGGDRKARIRVLLRDLHSDADHFLDVVKNCLAA